MRERLLARRDRRMTLEGVLVINAQRFRTQDRNREDARARLATFVAAPVLLVAVAALAGCWPARRASHVDPAVVLRGD